MISSSCIRLECTGDYSSPLSLSNIVQQHWTNARLQGKYQPAPLLPLSIRLRHDTFADLICARLVDGWLNPRYHILQRHNCFVYRHYYFQNGRKRHSLYSNLPYCCLSQCLVWQAGAQTMKTPSSVYLHQLKKAVVGTVNNGLG